MKTVIHKYNSTCGLAEVAVFSHADTGVDFNALDCQTMEFVRVKIEGGKMMYNGVRLYQCEHEPVQEINLPLPSLFCLAIAIMKNEVSLYFDEYYNNL